LGFVAGAVAAFLTLATAGRSSMGSGDAPYPRGFVALLNFVPIVVVLAVAGLVAVIGPAAIGFPLSGFVGASGYVVLISTCIRLVSLSGASITRLSISD
jgi:hypothetical protein